MTQTEQQIILDGNKLIAEFDGYIYEPDSILNDVMGCYTKEDRLSMLITEFPYHQKWEWLMPVVQNIEAINNGRQLLYFVSIEGDRCEIGKNEFSPYDTSIVVKSIHRNKLLSTFLAVVEFVKWHNNQFPLDTNTQLDNL